MLCLCISSLFTIVLFALPRGSNLAQASTIYELPNSFVYNKHLQTPSAISEEDAELYYRAFNLIHIKDYAQADMLTGHIQNRLLVGYLLYEKYISKSYRSSPAALKDWLNHYADLPVAQDIYKLLKRKLGQRTPKGVRIPLIVGSIRPLYTRSNFVDDERSSSPVFRTVSAIAIHVGRCKLNNTLNTYIRKGESKLLKNSLLDPRIIKRLNYKEYSYYCASLARMYFINGRTEYTLEWAQKALKHCRKELPETSFVLGLSYWRKQEYSNAKTAFSSILDYKELYASELVSKAAYWAARASFRIHDFNHYYAYLKVASKYIYDFYGILAAEELGVKPQYNNNILDNEGVQLSELLQNAHGARAFALLQFGLSSWAEQELILFAKYDLQHYRGETKIAMVKALAYLAYKEPMPMLGLRLAGMQGMYYGFGYLDYPIFNVLSTTDYKVDPLLLISLMRRESSFYSDAISSAGAIGLMQLMPSTAKGLIQKADFITNLSSITLNDYAVKRILRNPRYNFNLGQDYMRQLLDNGINKNNLLYALASWNGGVLNLKNWKKDAYRLPKDYLFFIENIPFGESRDFVKKVLTDYWVYQITVGAHPYLALNLINNTAPLYREPTDEYLESLNRFDYELKVYSNTQAQFGQVDTLLGSSDSSTQKNSDDIDSTSQDIDSLTVD